MFIPAFLVTYFLLNAPSTVNAQTVQPWDGVPDLPVNYAQDAKSWWNEHPFNQESPNYRPEISSPANQVNVLTEYNGDIQSAINALPATGGTLVFPEGVYTGTFSLIDRDNIHFIGQGNVVINLTAEGVIAGCQMSTVYSDISGQVAVKNPTAIECVTTGRTKNIYFKNLTFDGMNTQLQAMSLSASKNIVFDTVTFQNFVDPKASHRGLVSGNAVLDNIWFRNVRFAGKERYALYLDGLHGGGVINSQIDGPFGSGGLLFLTNDDLSRDYNNNGYLEMDELRTANHVAVAYNTFTGYLYNGISIMGRDSLVYKNTAQAAIGNSFVTIESKSSHVDKKLVYNYFGNIVSENKIKGVRYFTQIFASPTCPLLTNCALQGKYFVTNNNIETSLNFSKLVNESISQFGTITGPNVVADNCIGDPFCVSTPAASVTPTPTPTPTPEPTTTPTPTPEESPSPLPSTIPTPTPEPSVMPTFTPTPVPTPVPTPIPTPTPTPLPQVPNLILNGSFELGGTPWGLNKTVIDNTVSQSGSSSLLINGATDTYTRQDLVLKPSTQYSMSYWAKTQNASAKGITMRMVQLQPTTKILIMGNYINGNTDWTYKTLNFTTPSNYISGRVDVIFTLNNLEKAWIDNITLCEGPISCLNPLSI